MRQKQQLRLRTTTRRMMKSRQRWRLQVLPLLV